MGASLLAPGSDDDIQALKAAHDAELKRDLAAILSAGGGHSVPVTKAASSYDAIADELFKSIDRLIGKRIEAAHKDFLNHHHEQHPRSAHAIAALTKLCEELLTSTAELHEEVKKVRFISERALGLNRNEFVER